MGFNAYELAEKNKNKYEVEMIDQMRSKPIIEKNYFIQNLTTDLSSRQLSIVYIYCSMIDFNAKGHAPITIDLSTVLKVLGLTTGGANRKALKKELGQIRQKTIWVNTITDEGKKAESAVGIVDRIDITASDCTITFSDYFFQQLGYDGGHYAQMMLETIIALESKQIVNLYRLLKTWAYQETFEITVDKLRVITECQNKYPQTREFTRLVVKAGTEMINQFGDIAVTYRVNRLNRKTHSYTFFIQKKASFEYFISSLAAKSKIDGRLLDSSKILTNTI